MYLDVTKINNNKLNTLIKEIKEFDNLMFTYHTIYMDKLSNIIESTISILYHDLDMGFIGDVRYSLTENQLAKRIQKSWRYDIEFLVENLIECLIYQYMKIYKPQRKMNKFIRNEFKEFVLDKCNC